MDLKTFLEKFEAIAQAPGGIQKLRSLILDLAVRGKLVPQNSEDEPASLLLQKVQTRKDFLIKGGKIKKIKQSKLAIKRDEIMFTLPQGWCWDSLSKLILQIKRGSSLKCNQKGLGIRYITSGGAEGTRTRVSCNDILISITGDTGMIGLVRSELPEAYINQHIALLRPLRCIYAEYIARLLTSNFALKQLKGAQRGIKNSLGLEDIRNLVISLPPLAEQKRIVAKVDELMQLCDQLEASLRQSQQRAESLAASAISHLTI